MSFSGIAITGRAGAGKSTLARTILDVRDDLLPGSFAAALKRDLAKIGIVKGDPAFREIAQLYGTDHAREKYGDDYWIDRLRGGFGGSLARYVIDDVRFPNEANACIADGLLLVRVVTDPATRSERLGYECPEHESETALDNYRHHVYVDGSWPAWYVAARIIELYERGPDGGAA